MQFAGGVLGIEVVAGDFIDDPPILGGHVQGERLVAIHEDLIELAKDILPSEVERLCAVGFDVLVH